MSCGTGSCDPASHFPKPNDRRSTPFGRAVNAEAVNASRNGASPRRRFFSRRLNRISNVLGQPSSITLREFAVTALFLYAVYRGYFAADRIYTQLARQDVKFICQGRFPEARVTAMQCMRVHVWFLLWILSDWVSEVARWVAAGAVAVFVAEEAIAKVRTTKK